MPSTIQRLTVESAAWVSLPSPRRAVLRATVTTEGMSESIVLDLCRELADRLPWAVVDTGFGGRRHDRLCRVRGRWTENRDRPESSRYSDGRPNLGVPIVLSQPTTEDVAICRC